MLLGGGKPIPQDRIRNLLQKPEAVQPVEAHAGETALNRTVEIDFIMTEAEKIPVEVVHTEAPKE